MCLRVRLFREMGKWDLGRMGNGLLNGLIGGMGDGLLNELIEGEREYKRECKQLCNGAIWQLLKWRLHFG